MPLVQWSKDLELDVRDIDEQHRRLVEMLNELYEAIVALKGLDVLEEITRRMVDYAFDHFSREEAHMKECAYAAFLSHKAEHEAFMNKARSIRERMDKGDFVSSVEILGFLKNWLVDHILKIDKEFAGFYKTWLAIGGGTR